jgi:hypothetical protein
MGYNIYATGGEVIDARRRLDPAVAAMPLSRSVSRLSHA